MDFDFDFEDAKPWLIGIGVVLLAASALFGMLYLNVNDAIAKCEKAGYDKPGWSWSVTSCPANEDYASDSVALVVGNTANSPAPKLTDEADKYLRNSLAKTDGTLKFYLYSATPSGTRIQLDDLKLKKSGNVDSFVASSAQTVKKIDTAIAQPASENGADYFNTIVTAGRAVTTSPSVKQPLVLVIGSGLSDAQPLNFANGDLLHADPADVLAQLKAKGTIAQDDLRGVRIVWSGLGVTTSPQQPLDATEKRNLRNIYNAIFTYMGARLVTDDTAMATESVKTDKPVAPVKVHGLSGGVVVYKFGENSIGFKPGTATIQDSAKANTALDGVVANYQKCPAAKLTIEGYTARPSGTVEATNDLSKARADAVKKLLVARGVSDTAIAATGKGSSDFSGRVDEQDATGVWSSDKAQANRVVIVTMDSGGGC